MLHVSRIRVKGHFNHLKAELNPICHLLALLGTHHILHVSRVRVKGHFNPLNAESNPICCLLALLGAHHILHVSRTRVKENKPQREPEIVPKCRTALLEKLTGLKLVKKFPTFYGTRRFITAFTNARHLSLS